jgi:fructose-bisphosphate aldolase class II
MPLTATGQIVAAASAARRGAAAFNVIGLEHAEAIVAGAEAVSRPVILQLSENCVTYHGGFAPAGQAMLALAAAAAVPVAVHLDHATRPDLVREAIALGFSSVMFDGSALPYDENVAATAAMTAWCHDHGAWVEAELGEVGGKDGVHAAGARTDPADAAVFTAARTRWRPGMPCSIWR